LSASFTLVLAGCHVDLSGLNQLFSSDPTYLSLPGKRIGSGSYSLVSIVGTNASGASTCTPNPCRCSISNGGFETGDFTKAVEVGQEAAKLASQVKLKEFDMIRQRLELYQNHQPWRESFRATNAPVQP